ncbi:MAG: DUF5074 domain-containing protein [Blastocatellia bacterium]
MLKTFITVCVAVIGIYSLFVSTAKAQDVPIIYQSFINDSFDPNDGGYISILDGLTLKELSRINSNTINCQEISALNSNKDTLIVSNHPFLNQQGGLFIANLTSKTIVKSFFEGTGVYAVKEAPDGTVWAMLNDNQVAIIDINKLQVIKTLVYDEAPRNVIFSPDGEKAYISFLTKDVLVIDFNLKTRIKNINNLPQRNDFQVRPQELEISPDGNTLYVASRGVISTVNTNSLLVENLVLRQSGGVGDLLLKLSNDGQFLYICEYLGTDFFIYNTRNRDLKSFTIPRGIGTATRLQFSLNKKILYINRDYGISVFDVENQSFISNILTSSGVGFPNPFSDGFTFSGNFSIGQAPTLSTISPASGDNIFANQQAQINWQTTVAQQSYSLASHKIELSTNGGQSFTVIPGAEELPATAQSFTWTVPNIQSANAQIRVSTVDLGARRAASTTGNFAILQAPPIDNQTPTVNFNSPVGGETFNSGSNLAINWTSSDNVAVTSQDLSLSLDGGQTYSTTIATGLAGSVQSFSFPIPANLATNQARLRLVVRDAAGNTAQSTTASNFTIAQAVDNTAPTVTISQPSSNQRVIAGSPIQVNWTSTDNRAVVSQALLLSLDGGQNFTQVTSLGATANSFVLNNINNLNLDFTTPQAVVRITATDQAGNIGQANSTFIISPMVTTGDYQNKLLTVSGIGFTANVGQGQAQNLQVFINDSLVSVTPTNLSNNSITIKGNKKKLGIVKGANSVRLVVNGVMSNSVSFQF